MVRPAMLSCSSCGIQFWMVKGAVGIALGAGVCPVSASGEEEEEGKQPASPVRPLCPGWASHGNRILRDCTALEHKDRGDSNPDLHGLKPVLLGCFEMSLTHFCPHKGYLGPKKGPKGFTNVPDLL